MTLRSLLRKFQVSREFFLTMQPEELVTQAYKELLGRDPDPSSLQTYSTETHFLPQKSVLELARKYGVFPIEIQPDGAIGNRSSWISKTFLMMKTLAEEPWESQLAKARNAVRSCGNCFT
jgi:hypothetical protein